MSNKSGVILELFRQGKRQCEIVRLLNVPRQTVSDAINRFKELGHDGRRPGSGRKRTVNTSANRQIIRKRVRRNSKVSMRKIARETGMGRESVRQMAKRELGLKPYKLQKVQLLTDENKRVRLERCLQLKRRAAAQRWGRILFTDEKVFTVQQAYNHQNDRSWSAEAPGTSAIVEHRQNPASVMVWGGICASGKTPLVFVEQGVKINQEVYRRDILEAVVLPWAQQHFGDANWTFQQDSAPAHKAKTTQDWCRTHFPDFIASSEWPPYSPDLNPMDYSVWSILEARACATRHKSLESLKQSLRREWDRLSPEDLRPIAENFKSRLNLCIAAGGGHFETG
jgi:''Paired box'' domain.